MFALFQVIQKALLNTAYLGPEQGKGKLPSQGHVLRKRPLIQPLDTSCMFLSASLLASDIYYMKCTQRKLESL